MTKQPRNLNAVFGRFRRRMLAAELSAGAVERRDIGNASEPARRTMPAKPPDPPRLAVRALGPDLTAEQAYAITDAPAEALAQATGSIDGSVTDIGGGALPGVTVALTGALRPAGRLQVTGLDGRFVFDMLPPPSTGCGSRFPASSRGKCGSPSRLAPRSRSTSCSRSSGCSRRCR